MYKLAVNLLDLDRVHSVVRTILLGGKLDTSAVIIVDKNRFDEAAVAFTCDTLTAACICDTLRGKDRLNKVYPTRVYIQKKSAWNRLPHAVDLTVIEGNQVLLNPDVFQVGIGQKTGQTSLPPRPKGRGFSEVL